VWPKEKKRRAPARTETRLEAPSPSTVTQRYFYKIKPENSRPSLGRLLLVQLLDMPPRLFVDWDFLAGEAFLLLEYNCPGRVSELNDITAKIRVELKGEFALGSSRLDAVARRVGEPVRTAKVFGSYRALPWLRELKLSSLPQSVFEVFLCTFWGVYTKSA